MIKREEAAAQIARLSVFGAFYKELNQNDINEYIKALQQARSLTQAERFINDWIANQEWLPRVMNITAALMATPVDLQQQNNDRLREQWESELVSQDCSICGDSGITDVTRRWEWCTCATGATRRALTPGLVDEANEALDKLRARFPDVAAVIAKAIL